MLGQILCRPDQERTRCLLVRRLGKYPCAAKHLPRKLGLQDHDLGLDTPNFDVASAIVIREWT